MVLGNGSSSASGAGTSAGVIPKLYELLKGEYNLQTGLKKKITRLCRDLETMQAALHKVAEVPPDQLEELVKLWTSDVQELSYDVEDILDTYLVRVKGCKARDPSRFKRAAKKIGKLFNKSKARHQIDGMIKIINQRAEEIASRLNKYNINDIVAKPASTSILDPRLVAMYNEVTQLVGIDKPRTEIINMLSLQEEDASKKKTKIVSLVGIGGLGKTTLAKTVYDRLKPRFCCGAFVAVGRDRDSIKEVFLDILIDLDKKYMHLKYRELNDWQLIKELREFLGSKRYLIVIDDIWDAKSWGAMKLALADDNNTGSRIITTTRKLDVAEQADEVYHIQPLPCDKSKKLFYTRIFGGEGKCHDNQLDGVSDEILKKCGGVPLAIITMASLLVGKSRGQWLELCKKTGFRDTNQILSLSYYDLPSHLKTCLLYLSAFPEDYFIDKGALIRMWTAEGFLHSKPGARLFEVGEGYFNDLINRSMVQAVQYEYNGVIRGCRIHDMVLDLLCVKSQEENFVTISSSNAEGTSSTRRVRRIAHQNIMEEHTRQLDTQVDLGHVRSFVACRCNITDKGIPFSSFKLLRVLALEECSGSSINIYLGKHTENLLHLRYLGLRKMSLHEVPEGIGALKFLQTLDLTDSVIEKGLFPSSLGLLTQLICLHAEEVKVPNGIIGKLTSLEELEITVGRDTDGKFAQELVKLRELRVLEAMVFIKPDATEESNLVESLCSLHKIQSLELRTYIENPDKVIWDAAKLPQTLRSLILEGIYFSEVPSCFNPSDLPNLTSLELNMNGRVEEQNMRILGMLPELRYLTLKTWSIVTINIHGAEDGCFQKLISLSVPCSDIHLVLKENSTVLFTTLDSRGDDPAFASEKGGECIVSTPVIMPNLQLLEFGVQVKDSREGNRSCDYLKYFASLQKVKVYFDCRDVFTDEVEREEAALRHAIEAHPNRPTLKISRYFGYRMKSRPSAHDLVTEEEQRSVGSSTADEDVTENEEAAQYVVAT